MAGNLIRRGNHSLVQWDYVVSHLYSLAHSTITFEIKFPVNFSPNGFSVIDIIASIYYFIRMDLFFI